LNQSPAWEVLSSPWETRFYDLVASAKQDLLMVSPFISKGPLEKVCQLLTAKENGPPPKINVVTNLAINSIVSGSLDVMALLNFATAIPEATITYLPRLHAKVYVADAHTAIVTSGNLTGGGLNGNQEYGVLLRGPEEVAQVRADLVRYASLGSLVPLEMLQSLGEATGELKELRRETDKAVRAKFREILEQRTEFANLELLKVRARGKTTHGIFSETIIYLLRQRGPLSTFNLQPLIQQIHPDLCDDTVDRIIDDVHFGKKWKHHVRNAQLFLKRKKVIALDGERWSLLC